MAYVTVTHEVVCNQPQHWRLDDVDWKAFSGTAAYVRMRRNRLCLELPKPNYSADVVLRNLLITEAYNWLSDQATNFYRIEKHQTREEQFFFLYFMAACDATAFRLKFNGYVVSGQSWAG